MSRIDRIIRRNGERPAASEHSIARAAAVRARTVDIAQRSVEVVLATENPVDVMDWSTGGRCQEVLRMGRLRDAGQRAGADGRRPQHQHRARARLAA
jgi:hypothetical protein